MAYPFEKHAGLLELLAKGGDDYRQRLVQLAPELTDVITMTHQWVNATFPTFDALALWAN